MVGACGIFSWGMWDLVPWPGIKPGSPALGACSLGHWTTRKVPFANFLIWLFCCSYWAVWVLYICTLAPNQTHDLEICSIIPQVKVLVAQSYPTLCEPKDYSLPGSSVHGVLQARIQSGLPFPSPEDLPNLGIKPRSLALQANSLLSEPPRKQSFNKLPFYFAGFLCCVEAFKFDEVPLVHFCFCCFGVRFLKNHWEDWCSNDYHICFIPVTLRFQILHSWL